MKLNRNPKMVQKKTQRNDGLRLNIRPPRTLAGTRPIPLTQRETKEAGLPNRMATSHEMLLSWEITQKSPEKGYTRRVKHRRTMLGKILRWEIGMKSRNKKQQRKTGIARGTNRLRETEPWTVPPWELN